MNFHQTRRLDKMIGMPICFLLSVWRKTLGSLFERDASKLPPPKKILFIKLIEQGSTILAYDTLKRAVEKVGAKNVYFWVFDENRSVLDFLDIIPPQNVIEVRASPLGLFAIDIFKSLLRIRREKIDTVIDLEQFSRAPAILSFLTGAERRVGLHRFTSEAPYRGDLMTHRVQYNAYIHTSKMFRLMFESAYENPNDWPLPKIVVPEGQIETKRFEASPLEQKQLSEKLKRLAPQIFDGPIILMNANCSDMIPIRKWDSKRYIELSHRLLSDYPKASLLFTGAPSEKASVEKLVSEVDHARAISVAGKTSFRELMVLYTLSNLLLTNDSGPGHFSSMTSIYGITLFGPETPLLYGTLGKDKVSLSANLACSPCVNAINHRYTLCQNNKCMQALTTDLVYSEVKKGLDGQKKLKTGVKTNEMPFQAASL